MLARQFGRPQAIYAPDPAEQKSDRGEMYDYVRPLATIEPTAIALGLPVDASIGVSHLASLQQALEAEPLHGATVFVAWEHKANVALAQNLLAAHGAATILVPPWPSDDFDRIYIIRLHWTDAAATADFTTAHEGLDGQSHACPVPADDGKARPGALPLDPAGAEGPRPPSRE